MQSYNDGFFAQGSTMTRVNNNIVDYNDVNLQSNNGHKINMNLNLNGRRFIIRDFANRLYDDFDVQPVRILKISSPSKTKTRKRRKKNTTKSANKKRKQRKKSKSKAKSKRKRKVKRSSFKTTPLL
jgi:hypothetical protein